MIKLNNFIKKEYETGGYLSVIHQEPYSSYLNSSAFLAPLGIPEGTVLSFSQIGRASCRERV